MPTPSPIIAASWIAKFGGVEDVGAERDQAEPDAEREQRGDDRQPHRDHRAEGEEQDHDRRQQADRERGVAFFLADFLDRLAAELDLQAGALARLRRSSITRLTLSLPILGAGSSNWTVA